MDATTMTGIEPKPPFFTIDATDPEAARLLRDLATRTRPTDQEKAERLTRLANSFDAWRAANVTRLRR